MPNKHALSPLQWTWMKLMSCFVTESHILIWNPITFSWDVDLWQSIWKLVRFKWSLENIIILPKGCWIWSLNECQPFLKTKEREWLWWNFQTFGISEKPWMCSVLSRLKTVTCKVSEKSLIYIHTYIYIYMYIYIWTHYLSLLCS